MRTFFFSLALLLALVTGMFFYSHFLSTESQNLLSLIDSLSAAATDENWEESERAMENLEGEWERTSPRLALFTDHSLLDDIMLTTAAAGGYLRHREIPELMAEVETLRTLVEHIPKREKLSLYNIF